MRLSCEVSSCGPRACKKGPPSIPSQVCMVAYTCFTRGASGKKCYNLATMVLSPCSHAAAIGSNISGRCGGQDGSWGGDGTLSHRHLRTRMRMLLKTATARGSPREQRRRHARRTRAWFMTRICSCFSDNVV